MPWVKGQTGNPKGRPHKALLMKSELLKALKKVDPQTKRKRSELIAEAVVAAGLAGNVSAIALVWERIDGKLPQPQQHTGEGGGPIVLRVVYDDKPPEEIPEPAQEGT